MSILKLCMIAVMGIAVTMVIKQWKSDLLPLLRIGFTAFFGICILTSATPLLQYIRTLTEGSTAAVYIEPLLKALGIAILTQICSDICRESGENGIATGVDLAGKVEILLLCLPLISEILGMTHELLELGGTV